METLLIHHKGCPPRPFVGRVIRGRVVWPDRDIPYFDLDQLAAVGLTERYEKTLAEFEAGNRDAFWTDDVLMHYSFEAENPQDHRDPKDIAIRGKL